MKLHNTLTKQVMEFVPLDPKQVRMYSCGPTVYDHAHIGNLSAYIFADTLRRTLELSSYKVKHVMNYTDVDDKTILRSRERYRSLSPEAALQKLTDEYKQTFLDDMTAIGNDVAALTFVSAITSLDGMRRLITQLYKDSFAYIADDGVYFSIEKYKASGKKYGQLLELSVQNTSESRINNDEYDKESAHDFVLWKKQKEDEPGWEFTLDNHDMRGRPGWHIECSAMSQTELGQPFDIHTGGVDLIFPHHENEIAQSTAGKDNPVMAQVFTHNEHLLVDSKKMSKSLGNFFTLRDIKEKGLDPLAFRLMVLQSHYRSQSNFTWENLEAAQNRLYGYQAMADLVFQVRKKGETGLVEEDFENCGGLIIEHLENDLNSPEVFKEISALASGMEHFTIEEDQLKYFEALLQLIDQVLGLKLTARHDISPTQKQQIVKREEARKAKDWIRADQLRDALKEQGIGVRDTDHGQIWFRT